MGSFQLLEHTADIGIAAAGESLAVLFQQAALGLRQLITSETICPLLEKQLHVTASDREELLVNWLGELLYLFEAQLFLPAQIAFDAVSETSLCATLKGEIVDPAAKPVEREVKAITYHQIKVEQGADGWIAQVFVDL
jgi:SHS2 domain-containing protein